MRRFINLFHRRRLSSDLASEMEAHIQERAEELVESGMSPDQAVYAARAQFGNRTILLEQSREVWTFPLLELFIREFRIAARALRRSPVFTATAVLTLALGIGANSAVFSLIDHVLLRPLPLHKPERIAVLWEQPPKSVVTASLSSSRGHNPVSPQNFVDWQKRSHSFEAMAAISETSIGVSGSGEPRVVHAIAASGDFFRVLGVPQLLGRTFDRTDDLPGAPPVTVISYALWRQLFGGDPSAVGRTIRASGTPVTVIGVMPEHFDLPFAPAELWVPLDEGRYLSVIAKLQPATTFTAAHTELSVLAQAIAAERPESNRDWGIGILSLDEQTTGDVRSALWLLFGAVTFVLLIAAGNVANLLLARGTQRHREIVLRRALGAGRTHVVTHVLAESLLLSLLGGVAAMALAALALKVILVSLPALGMAGIESTRIDARVVAFTLGLSLLTTLLFGLAPALRFSQATAGDALRSGDTRVTAKGRGFRHCVVIVEVALSVVLLAGAGLLARSFLNQILVTRGFRSDHLLTMRMSFPPSKYFQDQRRADYLNEILNRVRVLPGVEAASSVNLLPMTGIVAGSGFRRADGLEPPPGMRPTADFVIVSPTYFRVMGIPLIEGRDFSNHDTMQTEPAIVVNQAFINEFFPGENPIGARLELNWNVRHGLIVGICADARQSSLTVKPQPTLFLAQAQGPMWFSAIVVRTRTDPAALARAVKAAVYTVDPDQALSDPETMDQVIANSVARPRLGALLVGVFAGLALLLAAVGLYGVLAYSVTQRTREIGIRLALGASSARLVKDVVRDGLKLVLAGLTVGLFAALVLVRLVRLLLFDVKPNDPIALLGALTLLLIVGLVAAWVPARRITKVDPMASLRWE
jgi:putative ABC transport system permease protein